MKRPVAVTGIGTWCSIGRNVPEFWEHLLAGKSGVGDLTRFPAGDMRYPRVAEAPEPGGPWPNRADRLAFPAAREALAQAGMGRLPEGAGVALGAGVGGLPESEEAFLAHAADGRLGRRGRIRSFLGHLPATTADLLAAQYGATGPRSSVTNACCSSTVALGQGAMWIAEGDCECVLTGGADALSRLTVGGFNAIRVVTPEFPRPFDKDRSGMVVGEGAAFLVLESLERARDRLARVLALVEGFGLSVDAYHVTAPDPDGNGALAAMTRALESAGSDPGELDHVNAHGTGTVANDGAEAKAIARLLGERVSKVPVVSLKGALGHGLGAAGALEAVTAVLTLLHQTVPPSVGFRQPGPQVALWIPKEPVKMPVRRVLSTNLAFGGNNAAVLLGRAP
jgi:3-oxoacyl-[acyl-carrier-protein] synthase II